MFRKNFNNPTAKFLRLFFRFGIIAVVVLGTFPPGIAQADVVNQSSSAAEQIMVEPVNLPPVSDLDQAWTHPASVAEDSPMQVPPPPMSMRYPNRNKPPYPPMQEMKKDLFSFERSVESSQTETAQALSSGAWSIPSGIDPRSLPAGITVDLTYDVVMGFVDPGEAINVTLGTEGYGAAVADGVGFFWTPIWHNTDGYQLGLDCGDSISIVVGTDPAIEIVPPCMTGGIDILNDQVQGSISSDTGGTSVTAALGSFDFYFLSGAFPPSTGSPQVTGVTAGDGSFGLSFTGIADLGAESMVSLDIIYASVNVRSYLYPESPVFMVHQYNAIAGFADVNQTVSATVYQSDGTTERWSDSTNASWPHGFYTFFELPIEINDVIEVTLDGGPTLTTNVIALENLSFDVDADTLEGTAPSGQIVRASMRQWSGEDHVYKVAYATATSGDTFAMSFSPTDLRSRDEVFVVASDTNGNQVQIASGPPYVGAYISLDSNLDCVMGRLDEPGLPIFVSLDKGAGEVYTRDTGFFTDVGNGLGGPCFVLRDSEENLIDFSPGDTVTLESDNPLNWSGSVEVVDFAWSGDTTNDIINGTTADGDLELTVHQWRDGLYPFHGTATMQVPVSSGGFGASFSNFDVRDEVSLDFIHYDAVTGYGIETNNWGYWPTLPYFELWLPRGISGMVGNPGETVEAWLYDTNGTDLLAHTGDDGDDDPYRFWLGDFDGHALEAGYKVVVSTSGGWSAEMLVPDLTIDGDISTDVLSAEGPTALLNFEVWNNDSNFSQFVPGPTALLDLSYFGWDLQPSDFISVSYQAVDGNRASVESQLSEVSEVEFFFNPGSDDWMWGSAKPGTMVTAERGGITLFTTYADPACGGCWNIDEPIDLYPGDIITVSAGDGLLPVVIQIPDPLTAYADSSTDEVWGQIDHLDTEMVEVHGNWEEGYQEVYTDSNGNYSAIYPDIPHGADGYVRYLTMVDWSYVRFHQYFRTPDLSLNVNYGHDWIEGWYPPGYPVSLMVLESDKTTVKATVSMTTSEIPWWGGGTGFSTNMEGTEWDPEQPDIQAGDWVLGEVEVDSVIYSSEVRVGTITGEVDITTDSITGTINAPWLTQDVEVPVWCDPYSGPEGTENKMDQVLPNGVDTFTCAWDPATEWDIQAGDDIGVRYGTQEGHWVSNVFKGYSDELILTIHYDHDWIDGYYEPDHTVNLTVYDSEDRVKATISLPTGYIEDWGDTTGFATYQEGAQWVPDHPDIQPGDRVHGEVDDGSQFTADVVIGDVTGEPDISTDSISGTVDVEWLLPGPVDVGCYIWEENGRNVYDSVVPDGSDNYECVFEGDNYYDIVPSTNLMVAYFEPEGHQLIGDFSPPVAHLRIEKWLTGQNVTTGGNAAFYIQYRNEGNAPAENVTITDTLVGMTYLRDTSGLPINGGDTEKTWDLGTVEPGDWISFFLFAEVTADEGQFVSNKAQISTSSPDIGDPGDKIGTWEGNVAGNDTYLSVGKDTWTWNPAPDQDFVYRVSVCNNGSTASSVVTLTDTLPDVVSLVTWWGDDPGWTEVDVSGNPLILEHSCISSWSCSDIYFQVHLSDLAEPGNELINHAAISGGNDLSPDDNETEVQHNVGEPYIDLRIQQSWHGGSLVPGGYYRYGMNFSNDGNVGIAGPIAVKATLPPGTSYEGWDSMDFVRIEDPPVVDGNEITWQIVDGLLPGYYGTIEVWVAVDPLTTPGTELNHFVEIDIQPEEDNIDNNSSMFTETINDHGPNLRITKNGGVHGHGEGHNLWYNLHVENIGDQTVNDIVVTDYYPTGIELDGEISTNYTEEWSWWDNDPEDQAFSVYLEYVGPGWTFDIDFNTVIPGEDPLEPGVVYENLAEVHPMVGDVNPDDNTTSYIMATGPDMYVEKTLETGTFLPDEQVTYLLTFGNMHRNNEWWWDMTGNAIITDILPEGMSYVSAELHWCESTEWCQADPIIDGQILTWNLYPIGRSNWNEIRLTVEIGDVEQTNPLINDVMIGSDQPLVDVDPYLENNFSFYDPGIVVTFNTFLPLILR